MSRNYNLTHIFIWNQKILVIPTNQAQKDVYILEDFGTISILSYEVQREGFRGRLWVHPDEKSVLEDKF